MANALDIARITILGGGGLMGHGIALACLLRSPARVVIVSRRRESVRHGLELVRTGPYGLDRAIERGKVSAEQAATMMQRISGETDLAAALRGADLVFESIPEILADKCRLLREAERLAPRAILATNTSSIAIADLASHLQDPARLVGTHWFYPAHIMPLVEVVRGTKTAWATLENVLAFLRGIGKKPVVVNDSPGFFMTRFVNNFIAEAIRLVELGVAGPEQIDEMVKSGLGWPMGVFELLDDTASFDSFYHAQQYLFETCGERYAVPRLAQEVFEAGFRGAKTLKPGSRGGWYDYFKSERIRRSSTDSAR